jgi:DNA-directed RNA polymerase
MDEQNAPATKGDIAAAEERFEKKIERLEERLDEKIEQLRSEMNHGYRDLAERLDDGITRMLNAFYGVAETHGQAAW